MTLTKSNEVAEKLRGASLNASAYSKGPAGKDIFIIGNTHASMIKVWVPEHIDPEVKVSRKENQAILNVVEQERTIEEIVHHGIRLDFSKANNREAIREVLSSIKASQVRNATPTVSVQNVKKTNREVSWSKRALNRAVSDLSYSLLERQYLSSNMSDYHVTVPVKITRILPESEMSFLVGIDESSHFIAMLPEKAEDVEQAHEILKPKKMGKNYHRQGEWFFTPVTKKLTAELDAMLREQPTVSVWGYLGGSYDSHKLPKFNSSIQQHSMHEWFVKDGVRLEAQSSHYSKHRVELDGNTYVCGPIKDSRANHHRPLEIEGWHRLWRNREVVIPEENDPSSSLNKRTRYWD